MAKFHFSGTIEANDLLHAASVLDGALHDAPTAAELTHVSAYGDLDADLGERLTELRERDE